MILVFKKWLATQTRLLSDGSTVEEALELHGVESFEVAQAAIAKRININLPQDVEITPADIRVDEKQKSGKKFDRSRTLFIAKILWYDGTGTEPTLQEKVVAEIRLRHKK